MGHGPSTTSWKSLLNQQSPHFRFSGSVIGLAQAIRTAVIGESRSLLGSVAAFIPSPNEAHAARAAHALVLGLIMAPGYVSIEPPDLAPLGVGMKVLKGGTVALFDSIAARIHVGSQIVVCRGLRFEPRRVMTLRVHDRETDSVDSGPVGVGLDVPIRASDRVMYRSALGPDGCPSATAPTEST